MKKDPAALASARTGRPRADDQKVLNGILYVLRTGCAWKEMPRKYGVCNGMAEVEEVAGGGGMDKDLAGVPFEPGWGREAFVVAGVPRRQLHPGKKGEEVGLTEVGKGMKRMLVVDGNGIPLAPSISRAGRAEVGLAQETLERVPRRSRKGRRKWADEYKKRWRVERTFAWLDNFRRLVVRWERLAMMYEAFCILACIIICLRELLK